MTAKEVGWLLFPPWLTRAISAMVALPLIVSFAERRAVRRGRPAEEGVRSGQFAAVRIGSLFAVVFTACYGLARTKLELYALVTAEGWDAMWDVACRLLFIDFGRDAGAPSGTILGVTGFLQLVCGVVAPVLFQSIYAETADTEAASVFWVVSAASALGLGLTFGIPTIDKGSRIKTAKGDDASQPLLGTDPLN